MTARGLCQREECRRQVLPQLAQNRGWLKLITEVRVEQTKRQEPEPKERVAIARIGRRNARRIARTQRQGYFGLARAIMERKRR
jgi:hypothetical protein